VLVERLSLLSCLNPFLNRYVNMEFLAGPALGNRLFLLFEGQDEIKVSFSNMY
jgi:hypothetical protein